MPPNPLRRRRTPLVLFAQMLTLAPRFGPAVAFLPARTTAVASSAHRRVILESRVPVRSAGDSRLFVSQMERPFSATPSSGGDSSDPTVLRPLVVCGPSGVGKGTIIERYMSAHGGSALFAFTVSHTTRDPRPGERDGVHYHFVTRDAMKADIALGGFLEHAEVHGNLYGTSLESLRRVQEAGKMALLDIDVQGVRSVKELQERQDRRLERFRRGEDDGVEGDGGPPKDILRPKFIFIAPPSLEALRDRLAGRGTETEETLARRTANAAAEMDYGMKEENFDRIVVNDELEKACEEFDRAVKSLYK